MKDLDQRNTETVEHALTDLNARLYAQVEQSRVQQAALAALAARLAALEQALMLHQARLAGHGPTVR